MKRLSNTIYDALRSIRLAALLIVLIAVLAGIGGVIPQGKPDQFYLSRYPGESSRILLSLGMNKVFTSLPFLLLVALFTVNLTVCSFHRLANELGKPRAIRRHGPDLLHIGLIIFIFGGVLSSRTRSESLLYLGRGETAALPDGSRIALVDLREERYADGRPKSWESIITIEKTGIGRAGADPAISYGEDFDTLGETGYMGQEKENATTGPTEGEIPTREAPSSPAGPPLGGTTQVVRVNHPIRSGGYTIYQQDWKSRFRPVLRNVLGTMVSLDPGARATMIDGYVLFMSSSEDQGMTLADCAEHKAIFLVQEGSDKKLVTAGIGDAVGDYTLARFEDSPISGLKVARDPGFPLVAGGLVLVALGAFLTYARKLKGMFA